MNRKYELRTVIRALFLIYRLSPPMAAKLAELDYEALSQALNYNAEPIYRFRTDNYSEERCEYRSDLLLPHNGSLIFTQPEASDSAQVSFERSKELWILDDLTIAVVSKIELTDSTDTFTMTYRTVRTRNFNEIAYEIDIDPDALAKELLDMAKSFYDCPMPFQEL